MFYIYFLKSDASDFYYIGHSDNPWRRLDEHNNSSHDTFTAKHRPWSLIGVFECGTSRAEAMKIEKFIKKQKSKNFIIKLLTLEKFEGPLVRQPLDLQCFINNG